MHHHGGVLDSASRDKETLSPALTSKDEQRSDFGAFCSRAHQAWAARRLSCLRKAHPKVEARVKLGRAVPGGPSAGGVGASAGVAARWLWGVFEGWPEQCVAELLFPS